MTPAVPFTASCAYGIANTLHPCQLDPSVTKQHVVPAHARTHVHAFHGGDCNMVCPSARVHVCAPTPSFACLLGPRGREANPKKNNRSTTKPKRANGRNLPPTGLPPPRRNSKSNRAGHLYE